MSVLGFILQVLPFVMLVYKEYLSADAAAKAKNEKFVLDQAAFSVLVQSAMEKLRAQIAADSAKAGSAWDAADKAAANQDPPPPPSQGN